MTERTLDLLGTVAYDLDRAETMLLDGTPSDVPEVLVLQSLDRLVLVPTNDGGVYALVRMLRGKGQGLLLKARGQR